MKAAVLTSALLACAIPAFGQTSQTAPMVPANCQPAVTVFAVPVPGPAVPARDAGAAPSFGPPPTMTLAPGTLGPPPLRAPGIGSGTGTTSGIGSIGSSGIGSIGTSSVGSIERSSVGSIGSSGVGSLGTSGVGSIGSSNIGSFGTSGLGVPPGSTFVSSPLTLPLTPLPQSSASPTGTNAIVHTPIAPPSFSTTCP
jgi:hypothetical protein